MSFRRNRNHLKLERRSQRDPEQSPNENLRVVTRLVFECLEVHGDTEDLTEHVKRACAFHHIAYDSTVVGKAIDSARVVYNLRRKVAK